MIVRRIGRTGWTMAALACMYVVPSTRAWAQDTPPDSVRSTLAGVYSAAQSARGKEVFTESCLECHTTADHSGQSFQNSWIGHMLSELMQYLRDKMPKSNPGSLTPEQYSEVTAFILSLNGLPAGEVDLPTDSLQLRNIRIEIAKATTDTVQARTPHREGLKQFVWGHSAPFTIARTLP